MPAIFLDVDSDAVAVRPFRRTSCGLKNRIARPASIRSDFFAHDAIFSSPASLNPARFAGSVRNRQNPSRCSMATRQASQRNPSSCVPVAVHHYFPRRGPAQAFSCPHATLLASSNVLFPAVIEERLSVVHPSSLSEWPPDVLRCPPQVMSPKAERRHLPHQGRPICVKGYPALGCYDDCT